MVKRTLTPLPKTVKEFVDFIYEYLIEHPDGLAFPMKSITSSRTQKRIASILVQRGIIGRTSIPNVGKPGCTYRYRWAATMPPTKTLYGSIVSEIRNEQYKWPSYNGKAKKNREVAEAEPMPTPAADVPQEPPQSVFTGLAPLDGFSDKELWDELKKRGYSIEENRLVIVKKTYLD